MLCLFPSGSQYVFSTISILLFPIFSQLQIEAILLLNHYQYDWDEEELDTLYLESLHYVGNKNDQYLQMTLQYCVLNWSLPAESISLLFLVSFYLIAYILSDL